MLKIYNVIKTFYTVYFLLCWVFTTRYIFYTLRIGHIEVTPRANPAIVSAAPGLCRFVDLDSAFSRTELHILTPALTCMESWRRASMKKENLGARIRPSFGVSSLYFFSVVIVWLDSRWPVLVPPRSRWGHGQAVPAAKGGRHRALFPVFSQHRQGHRCTTSTFLGTAATQESPWHRGHQ